MRLNDQFPAKAPIETIGYETDELKGFSRTIAEIE